MSVVKRAPDTQSGNVAQAWESIAQNYPAGEPKLQLATNHPWLASEVYDIIDRFADLQARREVLLGKCPNWDISIGTYPDHAALIAAFEAKGLKMSNSARHVMHRVELARQPASIKMHEITQRDVGFTTPVPHDRFFQELKALGFAPIHPEAGPQALIQYSDVFKGGIRRFVGSEQIVTCSGDWRLWGIGRYDTGVCLHDEVYRPGCEWYLDVRFLVTLNPEWTRL